ncbi:MAG: RNA polymerase sigma factor [Myxococcota bacterium]
MTASEVTMLVASLRAVLAGEASPDPSLQGSLEALFSLHAPAVRSACRRMTRDPAVAEELAQEALLVAWQKLPEFRGESSFSTWLWGITRNLCLNAARKRRDTLTEDGVLDVDDPGAGALSQMQRDEREELLRAAAEAVLTPLEQEAVHLRYVEMLSQDAITELLGIEQASGARGLLQACRRKLERELRRRLAELGHGSSFVMGSR